MTQVAAFSGGKDSTAMVLRLAELGEEFSLLFTPTGNELPSLLDHVTAVAEKVGQTLLLPKAPTLDDLIKGYGALPNWRQRWCTRQIKILPCVAYLKANPGTQLLVGLRADEPFRLGLYGDFATYRYPLREWGWKIEDVRSYVASSGVRVPTRTDCALCYGQRLSEWFALWKLYPQEWAKGEAYEAQTGHTFRSPGRDTWPAALRELRAEFEKGRRPRGVDEDDPEKDACRVCKL